MQTWAVQWRGTITRDVGVDIVEARSLLEAQDIFHKDHPNREIIAISLECEE